MNLEKCVFKYLQEMKDPDERMEEFRGCWDCTGMEYKRICYIQFTHFLNNAVYHHDNKKR